MTSKRKHLKELIETKLCDKNGRLMSSRMNIPYMEKHRIDYVAIKECYADSESFTESAYRLLHDIDERPKCKTCGKTLEFRHGFKTFCSRPCANKDPEVLAKNKAGVSTALKNAYQERGEEIKKKRSETLGGVTSPFALKEVQDKAKETVKERYGVENVFSLPEFHTGAKERSQERSIELWKSRGYEIVYSKDGDTITIKNGCPNCGDVTLSLSDFDNRMKAERRTVCNICPVCNPIGGHQGSGFEQSFIDNVLSKIPRIYEYHRHDRTIIAPYELDIVFDDLKLAIELNGVYWHSNKILKNDEYHYNKFKMCKDKGYTLISVWEHEYL